MTLVNMWVLDLQSEIVLHLIGLVENTAVWTATVYDDNGNFQELDISDQGRYRIWHAELQSTALEKLQELKA